MSFERGQIVQFIANDRSSSTIRCRVVAYVPRGMSLRRVRDESGLTIEDFRARWQYEQYVDVSRSIDRYLVRVEPSGDARAISSHRVHRVHASTSHNPRPFVRGSSMSLIPPHRREHENMSLEGLY